MNQSRQHLVAGASPGEETAPADTRTRLVTAAIEAFAAKGFHGTTTRDIAAAAGMSPAAVYVHHRSKEELLYLISHHGHESTLRLVREAADSHEEPARRLVAVVRAFVVHHAHGHTSARIVNYELSALSSEHQRDIADLRRAISDEMHRLVQAGVDAGAFHTAAPRMTTLALLSLQIDLARWYRDEGEWSPEEIADHYCELALRMVGAG